MRHLLYLKNSTTKCKKEIKMKIIITLHVAKKQYNINQPLHNMHTIAMQEVSTFVQQ